MGKGSSYPLNTHRGNDRLNTYRNDTQRAVQAAARRRRPPPAGTLPPIYAEPGYVEPGYFEEEKDAGGYGRDAYGAGLYGGEQPAVDLPKTADAPPSAAVAEPATQPVVGSSGGFGMDFGESFDGEAHAPANMPVRPKSRSQRSKRATNKSGTIAPSSRRRIVVNRSEAIAYSHILIAALQETLDYGGVRQRNAPPPALWIDDPSYVAEVTSLVSELRQLNQLLQDKRNRVIGKVTNSVFTSINFWVHTQNI
jgi:hypothetical protein